MYTYIKILHIFAFIVSSLNYIKEKEIKIGSITGLVLERIVTAQPGLNHYVENKTSHLQELCL